MLTINKLNIYLLFFNDLFRAFVLNFCLTLLYIVFLFTFACTSAIAQDSVQPLTPPVTQKLTQKFTNSSSQNPIFTENQLPGTRNWQLTNPAKNREIEGYASATSINRGEEIKLFVNTRDPFYTIEIYRMGWYGGDGGRLILPAIDRQRTPQPVAKIDYDTGLIECKWQDPFIVKIDNQWTSGFYLAKLTSGKTNKQSYIMFVVRDDEQPSDILFQSSVTTFQAYNNWGGMSLYRWNSRGKQATKVSFNRPYAMSPNAAAAYGVGAGEFLTNFQPKRRTSSAGWEYNMVRWLEKNGYDVSYCTDIDTHVNKYSFATGKNMLSNHKIFLSVGHDEYWSWEMRENIEKALAQGLNLGFFSANTCYWQIRFEPSSSDRALNRIIVAYKEADTLDPFGRDKITENDRLVTTLWRRKPVNRPEDALLGVMYETFQVNADITVENTAPDWLLANTTLDTTLNRDRITVNQSLFSKNSPPPDQIKLTGLLGYEVDRMFGNAPKNTIRLAHSPYRHSGRTKYSDMTIYTAPSGAQVFATGTIQWSWGLDDYNAPQLRPSLLNDDAQAMTKNILAKMLN